MAIKKQHVIAPKKSDAKKKAIIDDLKSKPSKSNNPKKRNEFGDNDAI